jgi:hypothetical protein
MESCRLERPKPSKRSSMSFLPDEEEWRPVVGYEDLYEVSSLGRVRRRAGTWGKRGNRVRALALNGFGYPSLGLYRSGKKPKMARVHVLVAEAFIGKRPEGLQINHKDGDKTNNCVSNLEYVTPSENTNHAYRTKLTNPQKGDKRWNAKLTEEKVIEIRTRYAEGEDRNVLAKEFNLYPNTIYGIVSGAKWGHVGGPLTRRGQVRGESSGNATLTTELVCKIRQLRRSGLVYREIAEILGVNEQQVGSVITGKAWSHVVCE